MKYQSDLFIETAGMEWETVAPGMKRKFMGYNDEIMMELVLCINIHTVKLLM